MNTVITNSYSWYNHVSTYLNDIDLARMSNTCVDLYMKSHGMLCTRYKQFQKSDFYMSAIILKINYTGNLIQELNLVCKISTNMMFEYIMLCYENWNLLLEHKSKLKIPNNTIFKQFLNEHNLDIDKIIPNIIFHYTHIHRPTKTYAFYKSLV